MDIGMLTWIILFCPLFSAAVIGLYLHRNKDLSVAVSVCSAALGFILALVVISSPVPQGPIALPWITIGNFSINIGLQIDDLSKLMLFVVTFIGLLVHVYSTAYMKEDEGKARYFAGLSLFMFSMLGIVLADNFVMMFIFWELVGVSSYILIGHWFNKDSAADAAKKAFLVNRIGDFGYMIGILMVWTATGAITFAGIKAGLGGVDPFYIQVAAVFVFCGAVGKSAQLPLHVWLPDAMEGPTPVSALIHAATMVAAGVFMLVRVSFLVDFGATEHMLTMPQNVIAWIGTITACMAGLMALQQDDIKRILAYSTLSQLGYMIAAVGLGYGAVGMFHLFTHAFFKALLFLGAGSVILGMHHEQNIWKMGCLRRKMPATWLTFTVGTMALCALPFITAGGYSKDLILEMAEKKSMPMFWILTFTAALTAFYMARLYIVTFLGKPRSEAAKHAHESPLAMTAPLWILSVPAIIAGFPFVRDLLFKGEMLSLPATHGHFATFASLGAILLGAAGAFVIYNGKEKDPFRIKFLENRFYIDEAYAYLVKHTQDAWAGVFSWIDRWLLDGVCVSGASKLTWGLGYMARLFQSGNLQSYAFLFGLGVVLVLYLTLFTY